MTNHQPPTLLQRLEMLEAEVAHGLLNRLRLARPLERFPARVVWAAFVFMSGFTTIALLAALAMILHTAFVFPSLGPTAFLLFFKPSTPAASPRNTLCGHAIGILCGYGTLCLVGLQQAPSAMLEGIYGPRVLAAALSLACTGAFMVLLRVPHPPAGATTLIVSLGIVRHPLHLAIIEAAVLLMVIQAMIINRVAGINYPWWNPRGPDAAGGRAGPVPDAGTGSRPRN